jgi:membrane-associated phospholipid phosphatase
VRHSQRRIQGATALLQKCSGGLAILAIVIGLPVTAARGQDASPGPSTSGVGSALVSDFKFLANNLVADGESIVTAPLHLDAAGALFTNPRFYWIVAGAGAAFGGSFALDYTMRMNLKNMGSSAANSLQTASYSSVIAATGLLYGYGLYSDDARAREYALTAGEGAAVAVLLNLGIKAAFGRLRPYEDNHDHNAFFHGGASFVSGDVAPMFALATGVSEYFDNRWEVALPVYSLALMDGFGRMGNDAHWFSDVVGGALLGIGTTELFLYLHRQHAKEPWRFRVFPYSPPPSAEGSRRSSAPTGLMVSFSW